MSKHTYNALKSLLPTASLFEIELPANHSLNDMWVNYQLHGITALLNESIPTAEVTDSQDEAHVLEQPNDGKLVYTTQQGKYMVLGNLSTDLATLKGSFCFEERNSGRKQRTKIDLYDRNQLLNYAKMISEAEQLDFTAIEADLLKLTDLLEAHREQQLQEQQGYKEKGVNRLSPEKEKEAIAFLTQPNLIQHIDGLIESSGIIGEDNNRKLLFVIASTYKMPHTLHGLIQGTSGSGKSHLLNGIAKLMPSEDLINITRVSSKSFYYYKKDELIGKLLLIQDIDGLDENAMFAFREMQTAGFVASMVTHKDKFGNLQTISKVVNAKFASLIATTHAEIYYDNLNRCIMLGVDESEEQTLEIMQHQNKERAGLMDEVKKRHAVEQLQNAIRCLKPYVVVNRYADQLQLPVEAKSLRRLNNHYQEFVTQITLLNQYQRDKDEQGRLITTVEDLKTACEIMFDAIMWKIDELDSTLRQFFERLKAYIRKQNPSGQHRFSTKEIRQAFNLSRSQIDRYIQDLKHLEYIQIAEGSANKGYKYKIVCWDDMEKTRQRVKNDLMNQINQIKEQK